AQRLVGLGRAIRRDHLEVTAAVELAIELADLVEEPDVDRVLFAVAEVAQVVVDLGQRPRHDYAVLTIGDLELLAGVDVIEGQRVRLARGREREARAHEPTHSGSAGECAKQKAASTDRHGLTVPQTQGHDCAAHRYKTQHWVSLSMHKP